MKTPKKKKMIAPVVIAVIVIAYFVFYFGFAITEVPGVWKFVFAIVPLLLSAVMIKVCKERIDEIKEGEEDDLSKY